MSDEVTILSRPQVTTVLYAAGVPLNTFLGLPDRSFAVPTIPTFWKSVRRVDDKLFRQGLSNWYPFWDCDDFTRKYCQQAAEWYAQDRLRGNAPEADAIAIFEHWWTPRTVNTYHATVLVLVPADEDHPEDAHGVHALCYEPQPNAPLREIPVGARAWETTTFVR